jgi:hypothetical protein
LEIISKTILENSFFSVLEGCVFCGKIDFCEKKKIRKMALPKGETFFIATGLVGY